MNDENTKNRILSSIFELIKMEPSSKIEMMTWYEKANKVKLLMELDKGDLQVPHSLWHYLDDADIRLKDQRYAEYQISQVIEALRNWREDDAA